MQERRHQCVGVDFELRQDLRGRDRVDDVRLAGLSLLRAVGLIRENERAADPVRLVLVRVGLVARDDLVEHVEDLVTDVLRHGLVAKLLEKHFYLGRDLFCFLAVTTHSSYPRPFGHSPSAIRLSTRPPHSCPGAFAFAKSTWNVFVVSSLTLSWTDNKVKHTLSSFMRVSSRSPASLKMSSARAILKA